MPCPGTPGTLIWGSLGMGSQRDAKKNDRSSLPTWLLNYLRNKTNKEGR